MAHNPVHILSIGKHRLVCGLFWQSLSHPREIRKEAVTLASKLDFDLFVIHREQGVIQAGFGHTRDGSRKGTVSFAALAAHTIAKKGVFYDGLLQPAPSWLGAFKLSEKYWAYIAVRDFAILPTSDFVGSREEVLTKLKEDYSLGGWNVVIGQEELAESGFANFSPLSQAELAEFGLTNFNFSPLSVQDLISKNTLPRLYKPFALEPIKRKLPVLPIVISLTVIVIILLGIKAWQMYQAKLEAERLAEEQRQAQLIERARRAALANKKFIKIPTPWSLKPSASDFARVCVNTFAYPSPGGWTLQDYVCTPTSASYAWTTQDATTTALLAVVPEAAVELTGAKAVFSTPIEIADSEDEPLKPVKEFIPALISRFKLLGIKLQLSASTENTTTSSSQQKYQLFNFKADIGLMSPTTFIHVVPEMNGIRFEKIMLHNNIWTIEGLIYAN